MMLVLVTLFGCNDACQQLCRSIGDRVERCIRGGSAIDWVDLRASSRDDFVNLCEEEWDDERRLLSSFDRTAALQECCDTVPLLDPGGGSIGFGIGCDDSTDVLSCDEVVALYGDLP